MTASPLAQTPNDMFNAPIAQADPEIAAVLDAELSRQQDGLEMIASENFVPRAVLQAQGSVLTNKYAEGYPGRRYYGGCEQVDKIETIARERAKSLFGAEYVNVQPIPAPKPMRPSTRRSSSRRHGTRSGPRSRRTSHPRHENQFLRPFLPCRSLWCEP